MSRLELFRRNESTGLTAAQIRRGGRSVELDYAREDFLNLAIDLCVLELQDETVNDLLTLLK